MRGPKVGSVMFCVATAPAPARACGHLAPTQIEEVEIATPNMPVRSQRPTIEKVMRASVRNDGGCFDLHDPLWSCQCRDDKARRAREYTLQPLAHLAVHRLAIADVGEVDDDAADVLERAAGL